METRDPGLRDRLQSSYAHAVFPDVGKAGVVAVGGAYGNGILYENGRARGFVELKQGSVGLHLGGETVTGLVLRDQYEVQRLKAGTFDLGADATAVALTTGAASAAAFNNRIGGASVIPCEMRA